MLPRTKRQAILLFGGLIVLAVALHLMSCKWRYKETVGQVGRANYVRMPLLTYTHQVLYSRPIADPTGATAANTPVGWSMSGLFARHSSESAKLWGIAAPGFLLGATAYLFLLWRYEDRRRKGRCTTCGHQMTPQSNQKRCPECGAIEA